MADNTEQIAALRAILRAGAEQVATDGTSVRFDLETVRRELRELIATDDTLGGQRPVASTIRLGGV